MKPLIAVVLMLLLSLSLAACGSDSGDPTQTGPGASTSSDASGPLAGKWVVDADATNNYHGGFIALSEKERADFEAARFEFTGDTIKYTMYGKSGEVGYTVESVDDQFVVLKADDGRSLRFIKRPDGSVVMPQDSRWAIVVLKRP